MCQAPGITGGDIQENGVLDINVVPGKMCEPGFVGIQPITVLVVPASERKAKAYRSGRDKAVALKGIAGTEVRGKADINQRLYVPKEFAQILIAAAVSVHNFPCLSVEHAKKR